jgi:hypothetical protein
MVFAALLFWTDIERGSGTAASCINRTVSSTSDIGQPMQPLGQLQTLLAHAEIYHSKLCRSNINRLSRMQ